MVERVPVLWRGEVPDTVFGEGKDAAGDKPVGRVLQSWAPTRFEQPSGLHFLRCVPRPLYSCLLLLFPTISLLEMESRVEAAEAWGGENGYRISVWMMRKF